jgi:hypothetical protein
MSYSLWLDLEESTFSIVETADGLEFRVAIDRPGARRVTIGYFADRRDAQGWIDREAKHWRRLAASPLVFREAA